MPIHVNRSARHPKGILDADWDGVMGTSRVQLIQTILVNDAAQNISFYPQEFS